MLPLVVSVQSQVVHGHVGNSAAAYPMRRLGVEVAEVPTTLLSNHPHYPTLRGRVLEPDLVGDLLRGAEERGLLARARVILSGFLGRAGTAEALAGAVARARAAAPGVIFACDPVMGDSDLGFFAPEDLRAAFATRLVPQADIVFPNAFELGFLAGGEVAGPADVTGARARLGVAAVVATSVAVPGRPGRLATVLADAAGTHVFETERLAVRPAGTGDLLAGLVAARVALGTSLPEAVRLAAAGVAAALRRTGPAPWDEMPIAEAIDAIVAPE
ncbi:MAG: pyridoxal kinase [Rhodobacteraceae bacterium]|nr:pyridoxal kinase [Paracoccaceae bacterium]